MTTTIKRLLIVSPMLMAFALGLFLYQGIGKDPNNIESSLIGQSLPAFNAPTLMSPNKNVISSSRSTAGFGERVGHLVPHMPC